MITADQLVAHAVGDYVLQSDWMASTKTKKSVAALAHVATYALPFLFLTQSPLALAFIAGTHFVIDRWRLARYVCWAKNYLAPKHSVVFEQTIVGPAAVRVDPRVDATWWRSWDDCKATGYSPERPVWLATWLLIITDNIMHVVLNGVALWWLS